MKLSVRKTFGNGKRLGIGTCNRGQMGNERKDKMHAKMVPEWEEERLEMRMKWKEISLWK